MVTIRFEVLGALQKTSFTHLCIRISHVEYMGKTTFKTIIIYFVPLLERPIIYDTELLITD